MYLGGLEDQLVGLVHGVPLRLVAHRLRRPDPRLQIGQADSCQRNLLGSSTADTQPRMNLTIDKGKIEHAQDCSVVQRERKGGYVDHFALWADAAFTVDTLQHFPSSFNHWPQLQLA